MSEKPQVTDSPATGAVDLALTAEGQGRDAGGRLNARTKAKYARYTADFRAWCASAGRRANPATSETLAVYAEHLLTQGYKRSTGRGRISAVKAWHRRTGSPVPDGVPAWFVLRDPHHTPDPAPVKSAPAQRAVLLAVVAACRTDRTAGIRDVCMATLAWDCLTAEEELSALNVGDLRDADGGLAVTLHAGSLLVEHDHRDPQACPVCAARAWTDVLAAAGAHTGPLFRPVDKGGNIGGIHPKAGTTAPDGRVTARGIRRAWRAMFVRAGLAPCTPRAFRLGGAVDEYESTGDLVATLRRGRWSPNTPAAVRRLVAPAAGPTR